MRKKHHSEAPTPNRYRMISRTGGINVERFKKEGVQLDDLYHSLLTVSLRRLVVLIVGTYVALNAVFALLYLACGENGLEGASKVGELSRFMDAFFFSVQTLATIGYGKITPNGIPANLIVSLEALFGLLSLAIITGLLFARFSKPTARIVFSNVAVINSHDEIPSLIFRVANERLNQIVDAQITVVLSRNETTAEGEIYRNFYDLKLERSRTPIFALTWTIVHPIDQESPLYGKTKEMLRDSSSEIVCSLIGLDETVLQTIHARFSYIPDEILWDKRFADILHQDKKLGLVSIDIDRIHDTEALPS